MLHLKSSNFDKFHCIADQCPMSCCHGWQIVIDDESLHRYKNEENSMKERLEQSIDWEESCFYQKNGRCVMLNDNELCDLQLTLGEDALCTTCQRYPRHVEEFEDVREWSLSLSCPEAARIILENKESLSFIQWDEKEEDDFEDFDFLLYTNLTDAREILFQIIQDRNISFYIKAYYMLNFAEKMQIYLDDGDFSSMEDLLSQYRKRLESQTLFDMNLDIMDQNFICHNSEDIFAKEQFETLFDLEQLNPEWINLLNITKENFVYKISFDSKKEIQAEQLLMFFVYTYFCGAVYDNMIYAKVLFAISCVYWIFQVENSCFMEADSIIKASYLFAREIEHSDDNLNTLEAYFDL